MKTKPPLKKVLLVENNLAVIALFREWFTDLFPESFINTVPNLDECLVETRKSQPDILIIDINLPGLDGLKAIQKMKETGINTKVIILTSFNDIDTLKPDLLNFSKLQEEYVKLPPSLNFEFNN
jgi:CheY-like chemotaxis protein